MLALAGVLVLGIVVWHLTALLANPGKRGIGDGQNVESYRFDLTACSVPRETLVAGAPTRDYLPALDNPATIAAAEIDERRRLASVRILHDGERVIGVLFNGEARAYPLWLLTWHEVCNDTVGGVPIAVTYSPLCDSSAVFDRRVAGEALTFGFSGLLYNSNLVMYDRRGGAADQAGATESADDRTEGESLWSQLLFRAIAGPAAAAGHELTVLPAAVMPWSEWRARYPGTRVILPDPNRKKLYRQDAYTSYFARPPLKFPVSPLPPAGRALKSPMVATLLSREPAAPAPGMPSWQVQPAAEYSLPADWSAQPRVYAFWFAWYAMHPSNTP